MSTTAESDEDDGDDVCCCCLVRPRTLRYRPCGHAVCCELCTIWSCTPRQQLLKCPTCRQVVEQLEVTNSGVESINGTVATRRYEAAARRGALCFESLQAFFQAMISYGRPPIINSAAQEVAAAAQAMLVRWNDACAANSQISARDHAVPLLCRCGCRVEVRRVSYVRVTGQLRWCDDTCLSSNISVSADIFSSP